MNELWGKLTNLSYEILGVFVPGLVCMLFVSLWWLALGSAPATLFHLPTASIDGINSISSSWFRISLAFAISYFAGHSLVWISRKYGAHTENTLERVAKSLIFRIPKPPRQYDEPLKPLMEASATKLGIPIDDNTWRRLYPLAKIILAENLTRSLVSTYQNKYTLHRSITAASAILFWLSIISLVVTRFCFFPVEVNSLQLSILAAASLVLIWGFSDSFSYYYLMWGNVIVTETYAVLSNATFIRKS